MIDFLDVAKRRLIEAGYEGVSRKRLDAITEGIVIRPIPGTTQDEFFDRSKTEYYLSQVLVKREDEERAMTEACDIADTLPHMDLRSENGSYRLVSCEVYTKPAELELSDGGQFVWQVRFRAEIFRKA